MSSASDARVVADRAFVSTTTSRILTAACRAQGLDSTGAQLLRHGENAIYRLRDDPVIVRIARHPDSPRKEVHVARWLAEHDFPAARLCESLTQLEVVDGRVVTWWEVIEEAPHPPEFAELAATLRRLHDLPAPTSFILPPFEPMRRVVGRLSHAPVGIADDALGHLRKMYERLAGQYEVLAFDLHPGPIHGDAHLGNLMRDCDDTIRLIDFEVFSWGPREWDACTFGAAYKPFGWMNGEQYKVCAAAYGWDSLGWSGFPVIRAIRELNMTTWLMQRHGESREIDDEIAMRIADLREGEPLRRWRQF